MWNDFVQINNVFLEYDGAINFGLGQQENWTFVQNKVLWALKLCDLQ